MKHTILLFACVLMCIPVAAQHFDPEHRHSIEISSGIPPIQTFLLGYNGSHSMFTGIKETTNMRASINIGYTYAINEKWDFNVVVDIAQHYYTRERYPEITTSEQHDRQFDWNAEPSEVYNGVDLWPSYMFDVRWKWYRTDSARLYSSFGLSYLPFEWPIFPSLTPIGINFGRNHFYGLAELTLSTSATFLLIGAGYRF